MTHLPHDDLDIIVAAAEPDIRMFDGAHLLVTGGTGFVGSWLVESVIHAQDALGVQIRVSVPSRGPAAYLQQRPHLVGRSMLNYFQADIRDSLDSVGHIDAVVHAATQASAALNEANPDEMLQVIIAGMTNVLSHAKSCGPIPVLFTSSGAVYGQQPPSIHAIEETFHGAPDCLDPRNAYHEGKRVAELLGTIASARSEIRFTVARLFAFLGPLLPLDAHFAAGNFLRDGLAGRTIRVNGDGTPRRSYQHPIDLTIGLWALLARGEDRRAYNVGSETEVAIAELAQAIGRACGGLPVSIAETAAPGVQPARYVPSCHRIRSELGFSERIGLIEAIARTIAWHRVQEKP